jgi:hypothetical protein
MMMVDELTGQTVLSRRLLLSRMKVLAGLDPKLIQAITEDNRRRSAPVLVQPGETLDEARARGGRPQTDLERRRARLARHAVS